MGIHFMENFDIAETTTYANIIAALGAKGVQYVNQTVGGTTTALNIKTTTENGVTRSTLQEVRAVYANSQSYLKIPIPASKVFYATFRLHWASINNLSDSFRLYIGHAAGLSGQMTAANMYGYAQYVSGKWTIYNGWNTAAPSASFAATEWITVEIARAADGKVRMWVNDALLYDPNRVIADSAITENFVYIGRGQVNGFSGGTSFAWWEYSDIIVVNPATDGLKYRPGRSARVLAASYTGDVQAEWQADPSVTSPHNQIMSTFKGVPAAADILTTQTAGAREKYSVGPLPTGFGNIIHALKLEPQVMNAGGAMHTLAIEVDTGAGNTELAAVNVAAGTPFAAYPVFSNKKGDGTLWTPADVSSLKVGFSAKS